MGWLLLGEYNVMFVGVVKVSNTSELLEFLTCYVSTIYIYKNI